jgi:hypothetical protein
LELGCPTAQIVDMPDRIENERFRKEIEKNRLEILELQKRIRTFAQMHPRRAGLRDGMGGAVAAPASEGVLNCLWF